MARAVDFIAEVERNVHNVVWNFPRASFVKLKRIEGKFGINLKIIRMEGNDTAAVILTSVDKNHIHQADSPPKGSRILSVNGEDLTKLNKELCSSKLHDDDVTKNSHIVLCVVPPLELLQQFAIGHPEKIKWQENTLAVILEKQFHGKFGFTYETKQIREIFFMILTVADVICRSEKNNIRKGDRILSVNCEPLNKDEDQLARILEREKMVKLIIHRPHSVLGHADAASDTVRRLHGKHRHKSSGEDQHQAEQAHGHLPPHGNGSTCTASLGVNAISLFEISSCSNSLYRYDQQCSTTNHHSCSISQSSQRSNERDGTRVKSNVHITGKNSASLGNGSSVSLAGHKIPPISPFKRTTCSKSSYEHDRYEEHRSPNYKQVPTILSSTDRVGSRLHSTNHKVHLPNSSHISTTCNQPISPEYIPILQSVQRDNVNCASGYVPQVLSRMQPAISNDQKVLLDDPVSHNAAYIKRVHPSGIPDQLVIDNLLGLIKNKLALVLQSEACPTPQILFLGLADFYIRNLKPLLSDLLSIDISNASTCVQIKDGGRLQAVDPSFLSLCSNEEVAVSELIMAHRMSLLIQADPEINSQSKTQLTNLLLRNIVKISVSEGNPSVPSSLLAKFLNSKPDPKTIFLEVKCDSFSDENIEKCRPVNYVTESTVVFLFFTLDEYILQPDTCLEKLKKRIDLLMTVNSSRHSVFLLAYNGHHSTAIVSVVSDKIHSNLSERYKDKLYCLVMNPNTNFPLFFLGGDGKDVYWLSSELQRLWKRHVEQEQPLLAVGALHVLRSVRKLSNCQKTITVPQLMEILQNISGSDPAQSILQRTVGYLHYSGEIILKGLPPSISQFDRQTNTLVQIERDPICQSRPCTGQSAVTSQANCSSKLAEENNNNSLSDSATADHCLLLSFSQNLPADFHSNLQRYLHEQDEEYPVCKNSSGRFALPCCAVQVKTCSVTNSICVFIWCGPHLWRSYSDDLRQLLQSVIPSALTYTPYVTCPQRTCTVTREQNTLHLLNPNLVHINGLHCFDP